MCVHIQIFLYIPGVLAGDLLMHSFSWSTSCSIGVAKVVQLGSGFILQAKADLMLRRRFKQGSGIMTKEKIETVCQFWTDIAQPRPY